MSLAKVGFELGLVVSKDTIMPFTFYITEPFVNLSDIGGRS